MVVAEDRFSPRGLRLFYLFLVGFVVVNVFLLYGLGLFPKGSGEVTIDVRMLTLRSWWMVAVGALTFAAAYIFVAIVWALVRGDTEPIKPGRIAVFAFALVFASVHSFRLAYAYDGNLPSDFITIFVKDLLGILLAVAPTWVRPMKQKIYRGNRGR